MIYVQLTWRVPIGEYDPAEFSAFHASARRDDDLVEVNEYGWLLGERISLHDGSQIKNITEMIGETHFVQLTVMEPPEEDDCDRP